MLLSLAHMRSSSHHVQRTQFKRRIMEFRGFLIWNVCATEWHEQWTVRKPVNAHTQFSIYRFHKYINKTMDYTACYRNCSVCCSPHIHTYTVYEISFECFSAAVISRGGIHPFSKNKNEPFCARSRANDVRLEIH